MKTGSRPAIVSTHSRPKAAGKQRELIAKANAVSTHSRPKAAGVLRGEARGRIIVSTHSRPKAAGRSCAAVVRRCLPFQHTAARRRLALLADNSDNNDNVSTHSRPKAAGRANLSDLPTEKVSTHSRPKAAGCYPFHKGGAVFSFNTQPPEGGWHRIPRRTTQIEVSTHSRPKAAGHLRHRFGRCFNVSTHSRPKAAGASLKSLAPSGFAALISLSSQEKREREYNTAFSVAPAFAIS